MLPRFWLAFLLLLFCVGAPVHAQTPTPTPLPVQMALASPFARTIKPLRVAGRTGKWVPIAVTLSNKGEPVSGELQMQLAPVQGGSFTYAPNVVSVNVDLPTNSNKTIWLYGRLDRADIGGFDVTYTGRGFPALRDLVPLDQTDPEQREVMVVSDADIGLNDTLRALHSPTLYRNGRVPVNSYSAVSNPIAPFSFAKELVPDRWIGFESADLVVLGDFPHIQLSPTQIDALRGYVNGGGTLVVLGGANTSRLSSSPLKDLWPITPSNSATASASEVADLVSRYVDQPKNGGDRLGGAPVVISRGSLVSNAALGEGSASRPLFTQRESGAGRVLFLSYDPSQSPFKGWSGQAKLWSELLHATAQPRALEGVDAGFMSGNSVNFGGGGYSPPPSFNGQDEAPSSPTGQLLSSLSHAEQLTMPPVSKIAWFLALYVFFLVPLNYAVLRIIDKRELAWITIPVIVVAFSVWAYGEALSIRGRAILTRQMDIVQSSVGSNTGRVDSLFWLFSPRRTTYDVATGGANAALSDYATRAGGEQGSFVVSQPYDGSSFKIVGAPVRMWTDRAFSSQSLGDLKGGLSLSGNSIKNDLGTDLFGAVWVQDGEVTGVGALANGASVAIPANAEMAKPFGVDISGAIVRASQLDAVFDKSARANGIPQNALAAVLGGNFGKLNTVPMLVAWGKKSVAPFSIGAENGQGRQMTLFIFRAPQLPPSLATHQAVVQKVAFEPFTTSQDPNQGGYEIYDCHLSSTVGQTLRSHGIGIFAYNNPAPGAPGTYPRPVAPQVQAKFLKGQLISFQVWDNERNAWAKLSGAMVPDKSPAGNWKFTASIAPQSVRSPDNLLRIRVRRATAGAQVSALSVGK